MIAVFYGRRKLILTIDTPALINKAKVESGMTYGQMAEEMHIKQARISEWIKAKASPTTDQIAYLATKARLPIIETVVALKPEWAHVWKNALSSAANS